MKKSTLILLTLATGFVSSMAALYVAYLIANKKLSDTTNQNPFLKFITKL